MRTFVSNLGKTLHDLVTSKKFLTGVLTLVVQALPVSADLKQHALEVGLVFIGAQGVADFGKSKAQIEGAKPAVAVTNVAVADPR